MTYTYVDIPNGDTGVGAALDTALLTALRDNALAIGEGIHPDIPDAAKLFLALGSAATNGVSSVTFNSLDLTRFNFLMIEIDTMLSVSTGNITVGGVILGSIAPSGVSGSPLINLENGIKVTDKAVVGEDNQTGLSRASTSVTISFPTSTSGTIRIYGVK